MVHLFWAPSVSENNLLEVQRTKSQVPQQVRVCTVVLYSNSLLYSTFTITFIKSTYELEMPLITIRG